MCVCACARACLLVSLSMFVCLCLFAVWFIVCLFVCLYIICCSFFSLPPGYCSIVIQPSFATEHTWKTPVPQHARVSHLPVLFPVVKRRGLLLRVSSSSDSSLRCHSATHGAFHSVLGTLPEARRNQTNFWQLLIWNNEWNEFLTNQTLGPSEPPCLFQFLFSVSVTGLLCNLS